jgi:hypothetical protein
MKRFIAFHWRFIAFHPPLTKRFHALGACGPCGFAGVQHLGNACDLIRSQANAGKVSEFGGTHALKEKALSPAALEIAENQADTEREGQSFIWFLKPDFEFGRRWPAGRYWGTCRAQVFSVTPLHFLSVDFAEGD